MIQHGLWGERSWASYRDRHGSITAGVCPGRRLDGRRDLLRRVWRSRWGRLVVLAWAVGVVAMLAAWRPLWQPIVALLGAEALFLAWWFRLKPSNDRDWDPSMAVLPRAVIAGDAVTIENVRNLEYRSIDDFTPRYETRTYHLSNIRGVDVIFFDWGDGFRATPPWSSTSAPTAASACRSRRGSRGGRVLGLSQPVSTAGAHLRRRGRTRRDPASHEIQRTSMGVPLPHQFERRGARNCFSIT